jgi:hypothetical protein
MLPQYQYLSDPNSPSGYIYFSLPLLTTAAKGYPGTAMGHMTPKKTIS